MAALSLVDVIGYTAAVLTTLAWIPQIARTWRTKSADDLSLGMLSVFALGVALWLTYAIAIGSGPILWANAVTLVLSLALIAMRLRFGASSAKDVPPRPRS